MNNLLSIFDDVSFDETITKFEYHTYLPYSTNTFNLSDEIRIPIQSTDVYLAPSESFIYLEGKIDGDGTLTNNAFAYLFDEIRYELNGVLVDKVRDVGTTTSIKNYVSLCESEQNAAELMGWTSIGKQPPTVVNKVFSACLPLKRMLGIFEDYDKIILASKHELVLFRSRTDLNAMKVAVGKDAKIIISKVEWHVPHVVVNDDIKLKLLSTMKKAQKINMPFRTWDLYELPTMRNNVTESWSVKTSSNVERPRYVIVGLQTNKKNSKAEEAADFDHCGLRNIKLFINSECYPYDNLNLKFNSGLWGRAYFMYINFVKSYYGKDEAHPILSYAAFKECPLFVIDCSKQNDAVKLGSCDVKIEFEAEEKFPVSTTAYCLIIHDCLYTYNPLTSEVRKVI